MSIQTIDRATAFVPSINTQPLADHPIRQEFIVVRVDGCLIRRKQISDISLFKNVETNMYGF